MPEILSKEQAKEFLQVAFDRDHPWYPIWVCGFETGGRSGELQGIRKEDCSLASVETARLQDKLPANERNYGFITIKRSWNVKAKTYTCTKGKYWRNVPVSGDFFWYLQSLMERDFGSDEHGRHLLPRFEEWAKGRQAEILRDFCESEKLTSVKFHTLRACFATHLLAKGVPPIKVQKVGGWKNLKTLEIYARLAGIDVSGVTEGLDFLPAQRSDVANVVNLKSFQAQLGPNSRL